MTETTEKTTVTKTAKPIPTPEAPASLETSEPKEISFLELDVRRFFVTLKPLESGTAYLLYAREDQDVRGEAKPVGEIIVHETGPREGTTFGCHHASGYSKRLATTRVQVVLDWLVELDDIYRRSREAAAALGDFARLHGGATEKEER